MKKVYLSQLKCPSGHAILAAAGEYASFEEAEKLRKQVELQFDRLVAMNVLNRECGLCKSTTLHVDLNITRFATMLEAEGPLLQSAEAQAATAQWMKDTKN